jgi:hypothetical protein
MVTRVNLICVTELHHKHLVSEYRELPRVFGLVRRAQARGLTPETVVAPASYTMGTGHVKFFYTRLAFIMWRQVLLIEEMQRRGYKPGNVETSELTAGLDAHWFGAWMPTDADIAVSRTRIQEKLQSMGVSS